MLREKGERICVFSEGRKGGGRIIIQTESVYNGQKMSKYQNKISAFFNDAPLIGLFSVSVVEAFQLRITQNDL